MLWALSLIEVECNSFFAFHNLGLTLFHPQVPEIWGEDSPPRGEIAKMEMSAVMGEGVVEWL